MAEGGEIPEPSDRPTGFKDGRQTRNPDGTGWFPKVTVSEQVPDLPSGTEVVAGQQIATSTPVFRLSERVTVRREDVEEDKPDMRSVLAAAMNKAMHEEFYAPTGVVLHPLDHAVVTMDPTDPESVEATKRVADSFGVPYWSLGIPGYRPPFRIRARARLARARRTLLDAPLRLPLVSRHWDDDWGWTPHVTHGGRWWVKIGRYDVGRRPEEDW